MRLGRSAGKPGSCWSGVSSSIVITTETCLVELLIRSQGEAKGVMSLLESVK